MALASRLLLSALLTLLTAASMLGVLDSPLYSFSGAFLKVPRYTLQWFMLAAATICAAATALEALWPKALSWFEKRRGAWLLRHDGNGALRRAARMAPAWLCTLLCIASFVKGTLQTGYATSFYRDSRNVMESESILLDNGYRERYQLLTQVAQAMHRMRSF